MIRRILVLVSVVAAGRASAQSTSAQAEAAFREGKDLMAKGQYPEACKAFDASQQLEPAVATQLNQANCREKNGQLATAWGLFIETERQTRDAGDAPTQKLHAVAAEHAQKIGPRVSKLTINVAADHVLPGLEIMRDKERIDGTVWNVALPIDGGSYTITAHAPGAAEWSTSVTVAIEGDVKTVDVPKLEPGAEPPVVPTPPALAPTTPVPHDVPSASTHPSKVVPLALGVGAVALLGGGLGFELWGESTYNQAKAEITSQSSRDSLYSSANTKRYVAETAAGAGLVCGAVAVWLYLRGRDDDAATTARVDVAPIAGHDQAGVVVLGRF